jgi:hypothetical protein
MVCYSLEVGSGNSWKLRVEVISFRLVRWVTVLIVSLALTNGNGHAASHLGAAHSEPCPEGHAHHHWPASSDHQQQPGKHFGCCCDCLGCSSPTYLPAGLGAGPVEFISQIRFEALIASLSSRAVLPEPDPPRPGTLS